MITNSLFPNDFVEYHKSVYTFLNTRYISANKLKKYYESNYHPDVYQIHDRRISQETSERLRAFLEGMDDTLITFNHTILASINAGKKIIDSDTNFINGITEDWLREHEKNIESICNEYSSRWSGIISMIELETIYGIEWSSKYRSDIETMETSSPSQLLNINTIQ